MNRGFLLRNLDGVDGRSASYSMETAFNAFRSLVAVGVCQEQNGSSEDSRFPLQTRLVIQNQAIDNFPGGVDIFRRYDDKIVQSDIRIKRSFDFAGATVPATVAP